MTPIIIDNSHMIDSTLALFDHMFYNLRYITLIIIQTEKAGNAAQD